jgi:general secretion pathway protein B
VSLILDALRKSENERQRQAGPGLAAVPEGTGQSRSLPWAWILGGLLGLNLLVLGSLLLTGDEPAEVAVQERPPAAGSPPAGRATAPAARSEVALRLPKPSGGQRGDVRPLSTELRQEPGPAAASPAPSRSAQARVAPGPPVAEPEPLDPGLPTFNELVVQGELSAPPMHIDIHVYSGNPAERFVFINMRKYREGERTREGPVVEQIAPEGVVMSDDGRRFLLPRD